jgi:hypothetical protein
MNFNQRHQHHLQERLALEIFLNERRIALSLNTKSADTQADAPPQSTSSSNTTER